jgi:cyclophilin family peptidyl-prolyl cis-trans isomerase
MRLLLLVPALLALVLLPAAAVAQDAGGDEAKPEIVEAPANPVVKLATTAGDITLELFEDKAPNTVANFIELVGKGYYDGLHFHRIIKDFMIQGGCPNTRGGVGNDAGTGGPGYVFADETDNGLLFDAKYLLAMANSGPNTNGSQFFITTSTPEYLNGRHTIFGKVIEGKEVVDAIESVNTAAQNRPVEPLKIDSATVLKKRDHVYTVKRYDPRTEFELEPDRTPKETVKAFLKALPNDAKGLRKVVTLMERTQVRPQPRMTGMNTKVGEVDEKEGWAVVKAEIVGNPQTFICVREDGEWRVSLTASREYGQSGRIDNAKWNEAVYRVRVLFRTLGKLGGDWGKVKPGKHKVSELVKAWELGDLFEKMTFFKADDFVIDLKDEGKFDIIVDGSKDNSPPGILTVNEEGKGDMAKEEDGDE